MDTKGGGWITFPFIIASTAALSLAAGGWMYNLMVYLIQEFHIKSIDAALIFNLVNGCTSLIPVIAAIIADSFLGSYAVVWISSVISFLVMFLNHAALITNGNVNLEGSNADPWRTCTVSQVEELKTLIKIFPIWFPNILLGTAIGIQSSLSILQSLTMDREISHHFKIPATSILVFILIFIAISLTIFDRFLMPACKKNLNLTLSPLQCIGTGHVLIIISMGISAIVETKRINLAESENLLERSMMVPMSAFWLVPQLAITGIGNAFQFPGQVNLFYQEFPTSLKSMSTALNHLVIAIAFFMSSALMDLVRKVTNWLPDNINNGKLQNVYWMLALIGVTNFCYYLVCACSYKYQNAEKVEENLGSRPGHE